MKRKWWLCIGTAMAALLVSLCFFGVRVRIAPRLVLSRALNTALTKLESRFEKSPVHLLGDIFDPSGCYQAQLQLETDLAHVGLIRYDMDLQTQMAPLRILGSGTVVTGGKALDISLYLDRDFAAVSSDSLVKGNYYGITYDTFSQDIRSRELLAILIGENTISQWENGVSKLADAMSVELKLPEFSLGDIRTALYAVLVLEPQVSKQEIDLSGEKRMAYAITFQATGKQIAEAAEPHQKELTPQLRAWIDEIKDDPDFHVQAVFFLDRRTLVKLEGDLKSSEGSSHISAYLGNGEETEPLALELETKAGENLDRIGVSVDSAADAECYQEEIKLTRTHNGVQKTYVLDHSYDLSSGEMELCLVKDGKKAEMRMHLAGEGERLTITTQNIAPLLDLFREKPLKSPAICTLTIMSGGMISTPEYRNLDQWSMEDLWTLLKGLGSLLGLNLP